MANNITPQNPQPVCLVGINKIAKAMDVGHDTVDTLIKTEGLPVVMVGGRWFSTRELLEKWITDRINEEKNTP